MKKEIQKSKEIINPKLNEMWGSILRSMEFPEDHMDLGAEYCHMHTNLEAKLMCYMPEKANSTLILALNLLSKLKLNECEGYQLDTEAPTRSFLYKLNEIFTDGIEEISKDSKILDEMASFINPQIIGKKLSIGFLFGSIAILMEPSMAPSLNIHFRMNFE